MLVPNPKSQIPPDLRFDAHVEALKGSFATRLCVLKRCASADWGCSTAALRQLYLAFVLPKLLYCLPELWFRMTAHSRSQLESLHLSGARAVAGLLRTTAAVDVFREANLLPLEAMVHERATAVQEKRLRLEGTTGCRVALRHALTTGTAAHAAHEAAKELGLRRYPREPDAVRG